MKFYVTATQPAENLTEPDQHWVEADEEAESLDDALAIIKRWVEAGEIEPYGHGSVAFHIHTEPDDAEKVTND